MSSSQAAQLISRARPLGWELTGDMAESMLQCVRALLEQNQRVNLTGVRSESEGLERLILDSLAFGLHVKEHNGVPPTELADLGTGGGIPGLMLAIALPETKVHLVESRTRKLDAVENVVRALGLRNVTSHVGRMGELARRRPSSLPAVVDVVTARAVGPLATLVTQAEPLLAPGGTLVCWKGDPEEAEFLKGDRRAQAAGLVRLPDIPYTSFKPCRLVRYARPGPDV